MLDLRNPDAATVAKRINSGAMRHTATLAATRIALAAACLIGSGFAWSHGDVTPQSVDTKALPTLGDDWRAENPYRGNAAAVTIGTSAYNQNCARCHGLEAISGGIAPDLRKMDHDCVSLKDTKKKQKNIPGAAVPYSAWFESL